MAGKSEQIVNVAGHRLKLTNLDKVLYPETGTTKAEVLDYYTRIADVLIPHSRNRPVTRKRWVEGVGTSAKPGSVFFEKNLPDTAPSWIPRRDIQHSDHVNTYPLVNDLATLAWMAQQAALELHVPQWRFGKGGARQNPDRIVLDLDPGDGAGLPECVEVAKLVREILSGMGLEAHPVTSGSQGIHLYAALDGEQTSDQVSSVAHELARALEADHPDLVVSDMKKTLRTGKVLLDWSQNNGNKTTIVPYSLRGRARPTVAAPRTWRELLAPGLRQLEMHEVLQRVAKKGDPIEALEREIWHSPDAEEKLAQYRSMRDGAKTPEPMGGEVRPTGNSFVIQEHHATALHYDFRLERDGVLVSWAVPKGVPTTAGKNHLAVHTEDHPLEYGQFEGEIPKGEYGAGRVEIWDRGTYDLEKWRDDEVIFTIHGEKHGSHRLALIQTDKQPGGKNWLLHLMKDQRPVDWDDPESVAASKRRSHEGGSWKRVGAEPRRGLKRGKSVVGGRTKSAGTVHPMLATLADLESDRERLSVDDWVFEMKWDGYRAIATVRDGAVELRSRNGLDFTPTYPELAAIADAVDGDVVLDGEIVALDDAGRPSFSRLQSRSGLTSPRDVERARKAQEVQFFAFDILERDGRSLTASPYTERREQLRDSVRDAGVVRVPPAAGADLDAAISTSRRLGLEGVMAKRASSPYRLGRRSRDWLKFKHTLAQEVVIAGWRPGKGARSDTVGSLLLGVPDGDRLRYVGRVGSGFSDRDLVDLRARLDRLARATSPLVGVPPPDAREARWVSPKLVGEVTYAERTTDGRLRAPTWRGWRADKAPDDVTMEVPSGP